LVEVYCSYASTVTWPKTQVIKDEVLHTGYLRFVIDSQLILRLKYIKYQPCDTHVS